ncbi:MAG: hypothetical protein ABH864_04370 [archaeon]
MGRRLAALGLAGLMAVAPIMNGCTTYAPRFIEGRYVGEQKVSDPGKTVAGIGRINGGLLGVALEWMGNRASRNQHLRQTEQYRLNMQRQIDEGGVGAGQMSPREQFLTDFSNHQSTAFICNSVEDLNGNGLIEGSEFSGDFDGMFTEDEEITVGYVHWGNPGSEVKLQLRFPSGKVREQQFRIQDTHWLERLSIPSEQRELGDHTIVVYLNGDYNSHGQFKVQEGFSGNKYSELTTFGGGNE